MQDWKYIKYALAKRWERIAEKLAGLREWLNQFNPRIMIGLNVVLVLVLVIIAVNIFGGEEKETVQIHKKTWFYDLNTGRLFVEDSDKLPPIKAPSGPIPNGELAGVRAYVFSYFQEPNESERFIGFLEKLTPKGKEYASYLRKSRDNVTRELVKQLNKERLIRRVGDKQWFLADSNEARAIQTKLFLPNEVGQIPHYYYPR